MPMVVCEIETLRKKTTPNLHGINKTLATQQPQNLNKFYSSSVGFLKSEILTFYVERKRRTELVPYRILRKIYESIIIGLLFLSRKCFPLRANFDFG